MKIQNIIVAFLVLASNRILAKTSVEVWQQFQRNTDCSASECAKNVPSVPLEMALSYYQRNRAKFSNHHHIGIIDFTKNSKDKRFYIINLKNGSTKVIHTTHGKKTEGGLGVAEFFSNIEGSNMSSLGIYKTDEEYYYGKYGKSLKLIGLSESNSNAYKRAIVIHSAPYAEEWFISEKGRLGLSLGCPAVSSDHIEYVIDRLIGGGLLLIYHPSLESL